MNNNFLLVYYNVLQRHIINNTIYAKLIKEATIYEPHLNGKLFQLLKTTIEQ